MFHQIKLTKPYSYKDKKNTFKTIISERFMFIKEKLTELRGCLTQYTSLSKLNI